MHDPEDYDEDRPDDDEVRAFLERLAEVLGDENPETQMSDAEAVAKSPYSVVGGKALHPERVEPKHDYEVTLKFSTRDDRKTVETYFENLLESLPNGTHTTVNTTGEVINVDELSWSDVGTRIRIFVEGRTVEGEFQGIYKSGLGSGISQTLIIDGKAWVMSFGVAEINV